MGLCLALGIGKTIYVGETKVTFVSRQGNYIKVVFDGPDEVIVETESRRRKRLEKEKGGKDDNSSNIG